MPQLRDLTPAQKEEGSIGYFKFEGEAVADGIIDARSAAKALRGFDSALRFFIEQERPELAEIELPIPVRIERGSWIADIPTHAPALIASGLGLVLVAYLKKAAEKMAEKDFAEIGLRDILARSVRSLQWLIVVAKHIGHTNIKNAVLRWDKPEHVGYLNDQNQLVYVPTSFFKALGVVPVTLLSEIVSVVEADRKLVVGVVENGEVSEVEVTKNEKRIFSDDETDLVELFPELVHGQRVSLDGVVTRGNEMTNTIGFWYKNHILTCKPRKGSIVSQKKRLFLTCRITGEITRLDKKGNPTELRPKIVFDRLKVLSSQHQLNLPFVVSDEDES